MQESTRALGWSWDSLNDHREDCLRTVQAIAGCIADDVADGRGVADHRLVRYVAARAALLAAEGVADLVWVEYQGALRHDGAVSA